MDSIGFTPFKGEPILLYLLENDTDVVKNEFVLECLDSVCVAKMLPSLLILGKRSYRMHVHNITEIQVRFSSWSATV